MRQPQEYEVTGKLHNLTKVGADLNKYYHIRYEIRPNNRLYCIIRDEAELKLLKETCFDHYCKYRQV